MTIGNAINNIFDTNAANIISFIEFIEELLDKDVVGDGLFFVFLSLQIGVFSNSQNNTDIESYANSLGINSSITLYHD